MPVVSRADAVREAFALCWRPDGGGGLDVPAFFRSIGYDGIYDAPLDVVAFAFELVSNQRRAEAEEVRKANRR